MIESGRAQDICPIFTALYVQELLAVLLSTAPDTPYGRRLAVREWAVRALRVRCVL